MFFFIKNRCACVLVLLHMLTTVSDCRIQPCKLYLMLVMSFLMESDTVLECPASTDHFGGSLGLTARERAVWIRPVELSNMVFAAATIGSMAARP